MPPLPPTALGLKPTQGPSTPPILSNLDPGSPSVALNENGLVVEQTPDGEWSYDPNEPRYCICNQVSYGDMVACDNEAVSFPTWKNLLRPSFNSFSYLFRYSVRSNGSIIHVLASLNRPKANGTARNVRHR